MPLTSQPTKTAGSLGVVKADLATPPNDVNYVKAAEFEQIKDVIVDVCSEVGNNNAAGSLNTRVAALEAAPPPSSSNVLWSWNETDTTQFDSLITTGTGGPVTISGVETFTREAGGPGASAAMPMPSLKVGYTGNVTGNYYGTFIRLIKSSEIVVPATKRFILRYTAAKLTGAASQFGVGLVLFDPTAVVGFAWANLGPSQRIFRIDSASVRVSGVSAYGSAGVETTTDPRIFEYEISLGNTDAAPEWFCKIAGAGADVGSQKSRYDWTTGAGWRTYPGAWASAALTRIGLGTTVYDNGPLSMNIGQLQILKHPLDQ